MALRYLDVHEGALSPALIELREACAPRDRRDRRRLSAYSRPVTLEHVNENPADAILGNYYDPGQRRLDRAWRDHERHAELVALQAERDEHGRLTWETARVIDVEDDFVEFGCGRSIRSTRPAGQDRRMAGTGRTRGAPRRAGARRRARRHLTPPLACQSLEAPAIAPDACAA